MSPKLRSAEVHANQRRRGFTLIEVMVTVAIVAILAAIAFPSFMSQVRASRRADAVATLSQVQQAQERWRANCPCYAGSLTAPNTGCPVTDCANTSGLGLTLSSAHYTFAMASAPSIATPNNYTITANGTGGQVRDRAAGASCATLTVTVASGVPVNSPAACWRQ